MTSPAPQDWCIQNGACTPIKGRVLHVGCKDVVLSPLITATATFALNAEL